METLKYNRQQIGPLTPKKPKMRPRNVSGSDKIWTKDSSQENGGSKKLTPYQGPRRACGMFHCTKCDKEWFSANSWANCFQKCNGCNGKIYPHTQFRPEKSDGQRETTPPHPAHQCQKCMQLGYSCIRRRETTTDEITTMLEDFSFF